MAGTEVKIPITAEDLATAVFNRVQAGLGGLNKSIGIVRAGWAALGVGALAAGGAIARAASEAEQASNRLNGVLRATGMTAGVTRAEIDQLAESLHETTQFDDESVRNAAAELLKFGNISQDVFGKTMKLVADYAAFSGRAMPEAAQAIGKAMSSPVEGMTMLERQIGKLHPAQEKLIKDLVESGRMLDAQGVVLGILSGKFGGLADQMNTGYLKATTGVHKAWNEMLEALGRSPAAAGTASIGLGVVENALTRIKNVIENGTWWEKYLLSIGMGAPIAMNTAKAKPSTPASSADREAAARGEASAREADAARVMVEQDEKIRKFLGERADKAAKEDAEREKRLRDEDLKGWVAHAEAVFREADEENLAMEKIWDEYWKREEQLRQEDIKGWVAYAEKVFEEADELNLAMEKIHDEAANKGKKAAQELGMTFSSAFEDAVVGGKKLRELLAGLAMDLGRLAVRKMATEPFAAAASSFFGGINWGGLFGGGGGLQVGADMTRAAGGPVSSGRTYLVGEQGPELFSPGSSGSIVPNHALGSGVTIHMPIYFSANTEAAVRDAVFALSPQLTQAAIAGVNNARGRGR